MTGEPQHRSTADVLRLVEALGHVRSTAEFVAVSLEGLATLVPADLWGFNDIDPHSRQLSAHVYPPKEFPPEMYDVVQRLVFQHPMLQRALATGDGSPGRLSDFWSTEEYHRSELYREAYQHLGVEYQVSFMLSNGPTAFSLGFAANRSDRDFTDDDLEMLQLLRPTLLAAWQRGNASKVLAAIVTGGEERPLIVVDANSRVAACNPSAVAVLGRCGVIIEEEGQVPEPIAGWLTRGARRSPDPLLVGQRSRALVSLVAGSPEADRVLAVEQTIDGDDHSLRLSKRESEIIDAVAEGATDAEIATHLGISARTVQKHLQRIYAKLGVANRTGALRASGRFRQ